MSHTVPSSLLFITTHYHNFSLNLCFNNYIFNFSLYLTNFWIQYYRNSVPHETTWNHEVLRCASLHTELAAEGLSGTDIYRCWWRYGFWFLYGTSVKGNSVCYFCIGPCTVHLFHEIFSIKAWHVPVTGFTDEMRPLVLAAQGVWLNYLTVVISDNLTTTPIIGTDVGKGRFAGSSEWLETEMIEWPALLLHQNGFACGGLGSSGGHGCSDELLDWGSGECLHLLDLGMWNYLGII